MQGRKKQHGRATLKTLLAAVTAVIVAGTPAHVAAQVDRQGQSVAQRNAPEFTRRPIKVGSFDLFANVRVDASYNDNIFALPDNEIDDAIINVTPEMLLVRRRDGSETRVNVSAGLRRFADAISENSERFGAEISTSRSISAGTQWRAQANFARNFEQRRDIDSFNEVSTPINFNRFGASAGINQDLGALTLSFDASARATRYSGEFESGGQVFDLSFRDFEVYEGRARASFARTRTQEFFVQLTADTRRFELAPLFAQAEVIGFVDRSSSGGRLEVGYRRQVTELLYLDVSAGYLTQDFDDPTVDSVDGLAFRGNLLWNASPLTSVRFTAVRRIEDSIDPNLSGLVRTEGEVQVEHELRRNIILIGRFRYSDFNQTESPQDGTAYNVGARAIYRLNPLLGLTLDAERFDRTGINGFEQNLVRAGITYNF